MDDNGTPQGESDENAATHGVSPQLGMVKTQFALICKASGICSSCNDSDAHDDYLTCFLCSGLFHAVCRDADKDRSGNEVICSRSFFKTYNKTVNSDIQKTRPGNFVFICDHCMLNHKKELHISQESKVDAIDKRVTSLTETMNEMKKLLLDQISPKASPAPKPPVSYASVASIPKRSVIVVDSGIPDDPAASNTVNKLITENAIHLDKTYRNTKGSHVFVLPTESDRDNLKKKLIDEYPSAKIHLPPEKLPTISMAYLPRKYSTDELEELVLLAHPNIKSLVTDSKETFKVLSVKSQIRNKEKYQASIRVSNNIRNIIANQCDRLYVGSHCCRVFDHFYIKRCNKCQKFNHYEADCKANVPVCGHCSGEHQSNTCSHISKSNFLPCCNNCKSNSKLEPQMNTHSTFDRSCPSYAAEQEKLRRSIAYYAKNGL